MENEGKPDILKGHYSFKQRKIMGKVMYQLGWGSYQLAKWLNMAPNTVIKSNDTPTPEAMIAFEESFRMAMRDMDMIGLFETKRKIRKLIPKETDILKLVKAGEFFGGAVANRQNNTQVNVYADLLSKYGEGVETVPTRVITSEVIDDREPTTIKDVIRTIKKAK